MIIVSSWDDGAGDDKVAAIYRKLNLPTTFYPLPKRIQSPEIYEGFEIGNHTFSHLNFHKCEEATALEDIKKANDTLSHIFKREILGFAYVGGKTSPWAKTLLTSLGFKYARANSKWPMNPPIQEIDLFAIPMHVAQHSPKFWTAYQQQTEYFSFNGHGKFVKDWKKFEDQLKQMKDEGHQFVDMMTFVKRT